MVALNRAAIEVYLAEPNPAQPIALVFGPDAGLVSERVQAILRATVEDLSDPFRLVRLEGDEMRAAGLTIAPDARAALASLIGGDRRASLSEIRKLALYARGKARVELADVLAVVADASALALDGVVDAAFAGKPAEVEKEFARARSSGIAPGRIVSAALIQLSQLHRARLAVESGTPMTQAVDRITPKAQFRRVPAVEAALKNWTAARLEQTMAQLAEAGLQTRQLTGSAAALSDPLVSRALLGIAP